MIEEGEEPESSEEIPAEANEPSDHAEDAAATQKAQAAARLGKKLRRKLFAKERPAEA